MSIHDQDYRDYIRKLERLETADALYMDKITDEGKKHFCKDFSYLPNGFENMKAIDKRFSCGNCRFNTRTPYGNQCLKRKELW